MLRLLLLTLGLIVYGSLYPWRFHPMPADFHALWFLVHAFPDHLDRMMVEDMGLNVLVYVPVGLFAFCALAGRWHTLAAVVGASVIGFLTTVSVEVAQQYVYLRNSSALDVLANTVGSGLGAGAGWLLLHRHFAPWAERWLNRADALLLAFAWMMWQVFPATPFLTRTGNLILEVRVSDRSRSWLGLDFLLSFAETLALARAVEVLAGVPLRRSVAARWGFAALLLFVPCKAMIWGRGATLVEVLAVSAAFVVTVVLPRLTVTPFMLAAVIVADGLAPFHFDSASHGFSWVPFLASLSSNWFSGVPVLLGKIFRYSALLWLLREARWSWWAAVGASVAVLGALEVLQTHLPGRSAEVTDPVLAVLAALAFWAMRGAFESLPQASKVR